MTSINASIILTDRMSSVFTKISSSINGVIGQMSKLDQATATGPSTAGLIQATASVANIENNINSATTAVTKLTEEQKAFKKEVEATEKATDKLAGVIKGLFGTAVLIGVTKKLIETSDQMTQIRARLDNVNDGLQTTDELMEMIFKSANKSRAEFFTTADAVAKLKNNTGDLFKSTKEVVEFSELLNKTFTASGTSAQEVKSVMLQLGQAMAMNNLRAQEYNSIMAGAPKIIDYIGQYMGVPIDKVKALAGEGKITAEVIKEAMFLATEDINKQFENIPLTFEALKTQMENTTLQMFKPLWEEIEKFANSDAIQQAIVPITQAISVMLGVLLGVLKVFTTVFNVTMKYWIVAGPVLIALTAIVGFYSTAILISSARTKLSNTAEGIRATITAINTKLTAIGTTQITLKTIADTLATIATWALVTATTALGIALAIVTAPLTIFIALLLAPIIIIKLIVMAYNKLTGSTLSMTDAIRGAVFVLIDAIKNVVYGIINFFISIVETIVNIFRNPTDKIKNMFITLAVGIIDVMIKIVGPVEKIVKTIIGYFIDGINIILGGISSLYNGVAGVLNKFGIGAKPIDLKLKYEVDSSNVDKLEEMKNNIAGKKVQLNNEYDISDKKIQTKNINDAWKRGANIHDEPEEDSELTDDMDIIVENTGIIADSIQDMDSNLSYLIDVSRREADARATNINVPVNITYNATSTSTDGLRGDVEQMAELLSMEINKAVTSSARGLYT